MTLHDVVKRLVGPINPIGETNTDTERLNNLKTLTELVDKLLTDIDTVAYNNKNSFEWSRKEASKMASNFLDDIGIVK